MKPYLLLIESLYYVHGEISQVGNSTEIFRHPKDKFVADFVGVENIIFCIARESGGKLTVIDTGNISIYSSEQKEGNVYITVRPEDITLSMEKVSTSARNVFNGPVKEMIDQGALIKLTIDVGEPLVVFLTRQSFLDMELNIGKSGLDLFQSHCCTLVLNKKNEINLLEIKILII